MRRFSPQAPLTNRLRHAGRRCRWLAAPVLSALLALPLLPSLAASAAGASAPADGKWSAEHVSYQLATGHILLHGNAYLAISMRKPDSTVDHYELRATDVDLASGPAGGSSVASATADGAVSIVGRTVIPASAGHPRAVRELQVTGSHAVFSGAAETVDITGNPRVQLTDSRLKQPAVVSGARLIHVNLRTRDFDAEGSPSQQVTGAFELASPPGDGSAGGSGDGSAPQ